MKDFSHRSFQLSNSSMEVKLVYTGYLIFAFVGYLTIAIIGFTRVGPGFEEIVMHYRGGEMEDAFPRTFGQMLEETHFHAFIEGVTLLVLAHLFIGTSVTRRFKLAVVVLSFGSTLMGLASPWLVKYVAPGFAMVHMSCWLIMGATALILIGVPLYEMWLKGTEK
jgi:hypothetical protein